MIPSTLSATLLTKGEVRLGGLAGVGATLSMFSFVAINEKIGGLFSREALAGEPIDPWLDRILAEPAMAGMGMLAAAIGFFLLFVFGFSLYRLVPEGDWRRTLAMSGYLLGASLALYSFLSGVSLVQWAEAAAAGGFTEAEQAAIGVELNAFMRVNFWFGPWLGIVIGHGCMAWSALRADALPRWLCLWALINAVLMIIGTLGLVFPALLIAQNAAPLSMLWMGTTGAFLLRSSFGDE